MDKMNNSAISDQSLMDKSMRSVFVGNIPYEATEENLKDIFSEVGPVLSFKLVFDRETGKPKGYGFCEYKDQETALSAMRNLNGYEIGGRTLRVDNACTEKSRMEMQSLLQGQNTENPYGEVVQADEAPEAISKAVASLPPDQMLELMRQMKQCIQNNPNEAKQMLLQNPQLAYALLQAQVVMKIVDPRTAIGMLHKPNDVPKILIPPEKPPLIPTIAPRIEDAWMTTRPPPPLQANTSNLPSTPTFTNHDVDLRSMGRSVDPRVARMANNMPVQTNNMSDSGFSRDPRADRFPRDSVDPRDPRMSIDPKVVMKRNASTPTIVSSPVGGTTTTSTVTKSGSPQLIPGMSPSGTIASGATDQEKAALIMQVLQLSDEQIAMLPSEQRQSILVLKEQIANSAQR